MPVSCVCSSAVRHSELSPLFINLLRDESRWVKIAAFQALGHFISTFADTAITGLLHNDNGEIIITDTVLLAQRLDELEEQRAASAKLTEQTPSQEEQEAVADVVVAKPADESRDDDDDDDQEPVIPSTTTPTAPDEMDLTEDDEKPTEQQKMVVPSPDVSLEELRAKSYEAADSFNHFQYWREPLPKLLEDDSVDDQQVVECLTGSTPPRPLQQTDDDDDDDDMVIEPLHDDKGDNHEGKPFILHKNSMFFFFSGNCSVLGFCFLFVVFIEKKIAFSRWCDSDNDEGTYSSL